MKRFLVISCILIILAGFACKETPPPNGTSTEAVTLIAVDISTTSVALRLTAIPDISYDSMKINMDGAVMRVLKTNSHDTLLFIDGLLPKRQYFFQSYYYNNKWLSYVSSPLSLTTMDTTSHAISWTTYELGGNTLGNLFNDVAIVNDTLVYADGEVYDTDSIMEYNSHNVARWDGKNWNLLKIEFPICNDSGNEVATAVFNGRAVYRFNDNDVWFSDGGSFVHWNGSTFPRTCLQKGIISGELLKLWGTSSQNLYAVGRNGTAIHFNGTAWQKINSGTDIDLLDVWGSPDGSMVWACGWNDTDGRSVLLTSSNRETTWTALWNRPGPPYDYQSPLLSLWTSGKGEFILGAGDGVYRHSFLDLSRIRKEQVTVTSAVRNIRGTNRNDIFLAGHGGMIMHYNGYSWKSYDELLNDNDRFYGLAASEKLVVVVGTRGPFEKALVIIGRR